MAIINDPTAYFQTKTYTGSAGAQSITFDGNSNLQPDWIWIKARGATHGHVVTDTVRGISAGSAPFLQPSATGVEIDGNGTTANRTLTSSNTNGFTLGQDAYYTNFNNNSDTYVSWNWKAGGTASSNTDGSITSSVSANTTSGFSIVSYTGTGSVATVGHGLSSAPAMIIIKAREDVNSEAQHWIVYHQSLGNTSYIWLNRNIAKGTSALGWNDTSPTSNVFSLGNGWTPNNYSGSNYIAYCFAEKQGYSKFGSYTGNGNADGTFVYTGFKPAFILIKQTNAVGAWYMWDNKRDTINPYQKYLIPNGTNVEYSGAERWLDSLSNGFKWRNTETAMNDSGATYIYMAIAENPFVTSTGVPATAR